MGALQFAGVVHKFLGLEGSGADGFQIAVLLDAKAHHGFAGFGNAVHHALGPHRLDADNVGVAARADKGAEVQVEVFTELQAAVSMGQGHGSLDVVCHSLAGGVGKVIQGQNDHMVANTHTSVFAAVAHKCLVHRFTTFWF